MLCPLNISGKSVGVLGLGRSGMAAAAALGAGGAALYLHDDQAAQQGTVFAPVSGEAICAWQDWPWDKLDAMVISPGIPNQYPTPHPAAAKAALHNVPIISEVEIAMMAKPEAKIIAITGTNGKSTTTALIGHCLAEAGRPVAVGGNIGDAACGLIDPGPDGVIVLELSSYQLETTPSLRANCAVILNITPDHLDRHNGLEGYVAAKARILDAVGANGMAFLGATDHHVRALAASAGERGIATMSIAASDAPAARART